MSFAKSFQQDANITTQTNLIDMSINTGALVVPVGTTAQRPKAPTSGMMRYNTTIPQLEIYIGALWNALP